MSLSAAFSTLIRRIDLYTLDTLGGIPPVRRPREQVSPVIRALEDPGTVSALGHGRTSGRRAGFEPAS